MPGDLTVRLRPLLLALAVVAVHTLGVLTGLPWLRVPAGLVLVLFAPGWFLVRLLNPTTAWWYAVALAGGLSFLVALATLLALELSGARATAGSVGSVVAVVTVVAAAAVSRLSPRRTLPVVPRRRWATAAVTGVAVAAFAVAGGGIAVAGAEPEVTAPLSQVGLVPDGPREFTLSITNLEGADGVYRVTIEAPGADERTGTAAVSDGGTWSERITVAEAGTLAVTVTRDGDTRELHAVIL